MERHQRIATALIALIVVIEHIVGIHKGPPSPSVPCCTCPLDCVTPFYIIHTSWDVLILRCSYCNTICELITQKTSEVGYLTFKLHKDKLSKGGIWIITVVGYWWTPTVLLLVFSLRFGVIITLQPLHLCVRAELPHIQIASQPLFSLATSGTCRHGCHCKVSTSVFNPQCTVLWFASYIQCHDPAQKTWQIHGLHSLTKKMKSFVT